MSSDPTKTVELEMGILAMSGLTATARVRRTGAVFSNLRAARYFSEQLKECETEHAEKEFGAHTDAASFYFFAAITASVASLEATYNTLKEDLSLEKEEVELIDKADLLSKYWWMLRLAGKKPFERSVEPAQSVKDLLTLRNYSVHYRPRWDDAAHEAQTLEKKFRARNIPVSPLFPKDMPFFPYRCCSHAYAEWAMQTVEQFLKDFAQRMEIEIKWLDASIK